MAVVFNLNLSVSFGSKGGRVPDMSDWATRKLEQLNKREAIEHQRAVNDTTRFQRVYGEGPLLWDQLKNVLASNVRNFNSQRMMLNFQEPAGLVDTRNVSISRYDGQRHLRVVYHTGAMRTVFEVYEARASSIAGMKTHEGEYNFDLNGEEVWFKRRSDGQFINVHDMVAEWLDRLID
jgi:hypothetical protein